MGYPEWVLKYKEKGMYVNKCKDGYYLYRGHSERVKGTKKVKRVVDEYIGKITEHDGLVRAIKKQYSIDSYFFGLPCFVNKLLKDKLTVSKNFSYYSYVIKYAAILHYCYGYYDNELYRISYFQLIKPDLKLEFDASNINNEILRTSNKINTLMIDLIGSEIIILKTLLSSVTLNKITNSICISNYNESLKLLLEKYNISLEDYHD